MSDRRRAIRRKCPICGKPPSEDCKPFCSKRCADIDLGRWFSGVYRVPTDEPAGPEDWPAGDDEDGGGPP